ncbi:hypothetical protein LguiB_007137 [Lonicera macranthoides]
MLFPNFSKAAKSKYQLFSVDLLGFRRSPKPIDSLYTIREHLELIERSVLGCILTLALAVKYPSSVKFASVMNELVLVGVAVGFVLQIEAYAEESA